MLPDESCRNFRRPKLCSRKQTCQEAYIACQGRNLCSFTDTLKIIDCLFAFISMNNDLRNHRIIEGGDNVGSIEAIINSHVYPMRLRNDDVLTLPGTR